MAIEVEGPDGVILEFPDGTSREVMAKAMSKRYPKGSTKPAPKASEPSTAASFGKGLLSGAANALMTPAELIVQGLSALGVPGAKEGQARSAADRARADRNLAAYRQTSPNAFAGGRLIGEVAASAPLIAAGGGAIQSGGRLLSKVAPSAGRVVQRVGAATKTGGIGSGRTAAQTAAMTRTARAGALAERAAGGAVGGGIGAAATGQNPIEGAAFGGALPVAAAPARKIAGGIVDVFRGGNKIRAAQMFRTALGSDIDAARDAFARMAPDDQRLARKVLIDEGIEPDTFMALGADVERLRPEQVRLNREAEMAAARSGLETAAGGATQEEIRAATRAGRADVTDQMAPVRDAMYERAGIASREVPVALRTAQELQAEAAAQSGLARRMAFGAERAETRLGQMDDLGDQFDPAAINVARGQAGAMGQRAESAAVNAIGARAQADELYDMVDDMAAQGMRPMVASELISSLRRKISDPEILLGSIEERTLKNVIRQLEKATDANGMLNPKALGKIRRSGINEIVNRLSTQMGGVPSRTGTPEAAQETVLELRSLIDDTLRKGGAGDLVDQFLRGSEQGYAAVNRGELAGEALRLFKEAPDEFIKLARGNRPKVVGKIMGGGPENEIFGNALSAQMSLPMTRAANLLEGRNRMGELASSGTTAANALMAQTPPSLFRLGSRLATAKVPGAGRVADAATQLTGDLMDQNVRRRLAEGFMSGQNANNLLNTYAAGILTDAQISKLAPYQRNLLAQSMRNYFMPTDQNAGF
jgi:hypothetical protein